MIKVFFNVVGTDLAQGQFIYGSILFTAAQFISTSASHMMLQKLWNDLPVEIPITSTLYVSKGDLNLSVSEVPP